MWLNNNTFPTFLCAVATLVLAGCGTSDQGQQQPPDSSSGLIEDHNISAGADETAYRLEPRHEAGFPQLHNLLRIEEGIYSGGEPAGDGAFDELAQLGVKTIVSVDGARPDIDQAHARGMRYVHIPIGYDGISADDGARLARVMRELDRPVYFHCHHGQHRGPAAAAIACICSGTANGKEALKILEVAGTSRKYTGLWRDVETYRPPEPAANLPILVAVAEVPSLAAAMAKLDRSFDNLKMCQDARWNVPDARPDLVPAHEALMVVEGLREARRHVSSKHDGQFKQWLDQAITSAESMEQALRQGHVEPADRLSAALEQDCKQCHDRFRN